jgi:hypothetical protein
MEDEIKEHNKHLYFHVGLAKTGSTYLQNKFFHKLSGLRYIHTSKFYKYNEYVKKYKDLPLLFSREFDRQFHRETLKIAQKYPQAKILIVLRSNEQWIASQYRRYVKNGGSVDIEDFIDVQNNKGLWKIEDARFLDKLEFLIENFKEKPLILFYNEFKKDPYHTFDRIAQYTNSSYKKESVSLNPKHKSYSEKQLLFLKKHTKRWYKKGPYHTGSKDISWWKFRSRWLILHIGLYLAKILPLKYDEQLIPEESLKKMKDFFSSDWNKCKVFAEKHSA